MKIDALVKIDKFDMNVIINISLHNTQNLQKLMALVPYLHYIPRKASIRLWFLLLFTLISDISPNFILYGFKAVIHVKIKMNTLNETEVKRAINGSP